MKCLYNDASSVEAIIAISKSDGFKHSKTNTQTLARKSEAKIREAAKQNEPRGVNSISIYNPM